MATAIFYASSTGNTQRAAERILENLGGKEVVAIYNVADGNIAKMSEYEKLIIGTSTWGDGDLQDDWEDVFEKTYKHELLVSKSILELVDVALSEKDYATFNFLQWYVSEQHEEEKLFKDILDKFEVIGMEGRGLFMIDREIASLVQ